MEDTHQTQGKKSNPHPKNPQPWENVKISELKAIQGVCLDIDETLSTQGKLTSEAYSSLWKLKDAGFTIVPLTGRPAGWCDHIIRFWPVDAVVGENGAFIFFMERGTRKRLDTPCIEDPRLLKKKLKHLEMRIKKLFPDTKWASDQPYREYDLAVDVSEDVPLWPEDKIKKLLWYCQKSGARAKLSSIHVNIWFGGYDKFFGFQHWLSSGLPGVGSKKINLRLKNWLFIGDSPNDEPLFEKFRFSVGVANLRKYLNQLKYRPNWLTQSQSGAGFSEMVNQLVRFKKISE